MNMGKKTKHRRPRLRRVRPDETDRLARQFCLTASTSLFALGLSLIGVGKQEVGIFVIMVAIPFVILTRRFKKVKIKAGGIEVEVQ